MDYAIFILYIFIIFCRSNVVSQLCDAGQELIICQYQQCILWCRPMSSIQILSASYGMGPNSRTNCSKKYENHVTCSASTAMQLISTTCENKTSCIFEARNEVIDSGSCPNTYKYVNLSYTCTDEPHNTSSTSIITGFIVGLVVLSLIILICCFVLLYQRFKLKREDQERTMNVIINSNSTARNETLSTTNNYQLSDVAYHQYSEISLLTPNPGTCAELSSCIPVPDYSGHISQPGNNMDYHEIDCVDGVAANKSNLRFKNNVNDGAYFILDPKETGANKSKEFQQEDSTKSDSNEAKCKEAQFMDQTNIQGKLKSHIAGEYGDPVEYNHLLSINHSTSRSEDLYDRVGDDMYDVSSHKKVMKDDDTYGHSNVLK